MFKRFFKSEDKSWALRFMSIEYQKDYKQLERLGIRITPDVAYNYLMNIGGINNVKKN